MEGPPITTPILTGAERQTQWDSSDWGLLSLFFNESRCVVIQEILNSKNNEISSYFYLISFHPATSDTVLSQLFILCLRELRFTLSYNFCLLVITTPVAVSGLDVTTSQAWVCGYCSGWLSPRAKKNLEEATVPCSVGPEAGTVMRGIFLT